MPDFNPNDMDALFREGAERHEFEYNPNAWALMEEKLDRKERNRKLFYLIAGFLLLITVVGAFVFWSDDHSEKHTEVMAKEVQDEMQMITPKMVEIFESQSHDKVEQEPNAIQIPSTPSNEYISVDSKESRRNIVAQNSFQSESTGNLVGNEVVSTPSQNDDTKTAVQDKIETRQEVRSAEYVEEVDYSPTRTEKPGLVIVTLENRKTYLIKRNALDFGSMNLEPEVKTEPTFPLASENRLVVTLFANPEWSSVGLFTASKTGWSFGSRIGYQFSDKFEFSAGIAYSRKIYKGGGDAYQMDGGWFQDIQPERMDAKCDVIEVPIGMAFYLNGYQKDGFFVDLGFSSYMLHSEWYGFEYEDALLLRPKKYEEVIEEDENSHLIGVGRISVGYQKVLSNKSAIQVAPYLQLPLTGIGAGQVNVYSSGVQIAVKFNTQ